MSGGVNIKIEAKGFDTVQNVLGSMVARSVRMAPLMARLGVALVSIVHTNFAAEGRPKWKPLSVKTVWSMQEAAVQQERQTKRWQNAKTEATKSKYESTRVDRNVGGHKLLAQSGALRQSIVVGEVTESSIEIGSSLPYARIHQLGGIIGPITIKPRSKKALLIPTMYGYILRRSANIPERKIPARPYLSVHAEDVPLLAGLTMQYIREGR